MSISIHLSRSSFSRFNMQFKVNVLRVIIYKRQVLHITMNSGDHSVFFKFCIQSQCSNRKYFKLIVESDFGQKAFE